MNRTLRTLLLGGLFAGVAVPAAGFAFDGGDGHGARAGQRHRAGPAHRMMRMAEEVGLSDAQRDQIRAVMQDHRDTFQALRAERRDALAAMDEAIVSGADNDTIAERAIAAHAAHQDARALRRDVRQQVAAILTPEQKARLKELRAERRAARGARGARSGAGQDGFDL
jgi:periplasmic protein CpxP/Spy